MTSSTLKVLYTPSYISVDEFARIFSPLEGYQTCRLVKGPDGEYVAPIPENSDLLDLKFLALVKKWF
jgi:hypothetical protein